ncbi:hypothetical protein, partial [Mitsuokella jalaludinii]|uniref:hypothetical protein n=2 Tax=Mitsuokella jalaludinii TaxID=187979 RepID=UPI003076FD9D
SFERLCFKRLIYCTASLSDCQELFYFSFCLSHLLQQGASNQGAMFSLEPVSRGDLYYITGRASICQPLS